MMTHADTIRAQLESGPKMHAELLKATGIRPTVLSAALYSMSRRGDIESDGRGTPWRLKTAGKAVASGKTMRVVAKATKRVGTSVRKTKARDGDAGGDDIASKLRARADTLEKKAARLREMADEYEGEV